MSHYFEIDSRFDRFETTTYGARRLVVTRYCGAIPQCREQLHLNYFRSVRKVSMFRRFLMYRTAQVVREPPVAVVEPPCRYTIYEFSEIPHWSYYFRDLKPYRDEIRAGILEMLTPARQREYASMPNPVVVCAVRMGDFRPLREGEDFAKVGNVRTPLSYFIDIIRGIREIHGSELPVVVVTDGTRKQLRELTALPNVYLGPRNSKIVDILMMASCRVLVPSAGSSFGYWAGFLGDCAVIMHPDHVHQPLRPSSVNERFFEGAVVGPPNRWPELLRRNIRSIGMSGAVGPDSQQVCSV